MKALFLTNEYPPTIYGGAGGFLLALALRSVTPSRTASARLSRIRNLLGIVRNCADTTGTRTIVEHARSRFRRVLISNAKMGKSTGRRGRE